MNKKNECEVKSVKSISRTKKKFSLVGKTFTFKIKRFPINFHLEIELS